MKHKEMKALMGKVVVATSKLERVVTEKLIYWKSKEIKHRSGWVVGFRYLQTGRLAIRNMTPLFSTHGDGYLKQTEKQTLCVLVAYWPTMKPEKVPLDGYRIARENEEPCFMHDVWTEENKRAMAEKSKYWQQDGVGGRWVSG